MSDKIELDLQAERLTELDREGRAIIAQIRYLLKRADTPEAKAICERIDRWFEDRDLEYLWTSSLLAEIREREN